jgi:Flp pilus assembly pilin Flp
MRSALLKKLRAFHKDEEGVTLIEYGVALLLAVTFGVAGMTVLGNAFTATMGNAAAAMP